MLGPLLQRLAFLSNDDKFNSIQNISCKLKISSHFFVYFPIHVLWSDSITTSEAETSRESALLMGAYYVGTLQR